MGDVFDALNRAKRERGSQNEPAKPTPPTPPAGEDAVSAFDALDAAAANPQQPAQPMQHAEPEAEQGGLAFDDVDTEALVKEVQRERETASGSMHGSSSASASLPPAPPAPPRFSQSESRPHPVSAAADRAKAEAQELYENRLDIADPTEVQVPASKLNGYSAEVVVHHDRGSAVTEQYRAIRTQLLARSRNRPMQLTVLTSSTPEEGKSVTTANLGIVFSELRNHKTLLIEGDLRRPSFSKLFDRECTPGMLQVLRGEVTDIDQAIHPTIYDNLQFIPAGGRDSTHSTELLSSPRMHQLMDQLKDRYDHIFIDSPPVITVTDACILGAMADQVLLVVRLNKTPSGAVERAKRLLRASNCDVSGVILTHMQHYISRYLYKYSYGYGYGYGYADKK